MNEKVRRSSTERVISLAVLAAVLAVFARALEAGFVYWDDDIVYENPHIRGLDWHRIRWMFTDMEYVWRYMPLTWLGWAVTYELLGLNPLGYHLGNLLFHGANAVMVFYLLRKLFLLGTPDGGTLERRNDLLWCCGLGAMLWAIHPLRVEPVVWVTDRVYCQALFFLLISLLCYLKFCDPANSRKRKYYWCSVGAFAASLLSYQTGLGYVLVLPLLDAYPLRRFNRGGGWWRDATARRIWLEKVPFAAAAAVVLALTLLARFRVEGTAGFPQPVSLSEFGLTERAAQAFYIWAYYFWRPWFPLNLSPFYTTLISVQPTAPRFVLSAILVIGMTALLAFKRRQWPLFWWLWLCHLILLVPMLGLTEHPHFPSDRYSFIVGITWSVLAAAGLWTLRTGPLRQVSRAVAIAVLFVLGAMSYRQSGIWQNSVILHEYMIKQLGDDPRRVWLYRRLARMYTEQGDDSNAAESFRKVLRIDPNSVEAHESLGDFLFRQGLAEQASSHYAEALRIAPDNFRVHQNLGSALASQGRLTEAIDHFSKALELNPRSAIGHRNLARALEKLGRADEARPHALEAQRLEPQQPVQPE